MSFIDPDYPTTAGDFSQFTSGGQQPVASSFYYNGTGFGATPQYQADSRRNDQPFNPPMQSQNTFPNQQSGPDMNAFNALYATQNGYPVQGNPLYNNDANLKPFSSYPPEYQTPQNPFATPQMSDSRRFDEQAVQNPWASQAPQNPWAVQQPSNPFDQPNWNQSQCGYRTECPALYADFNNQPMSKKQPNWDNMFTQPAPPQMPYAEWNKFIDNTQAQAPQYPPITPPGVPTVTEPEVSWTSIVQKNWKK